MILYMKLLLGVLKSKGACPKVRACLLIGWSLFALIDQFHLIGRTLTSDRGSTADDQNSLIDVIGQVEVSAEGVVCVQLEWDHVDLIAIGDQVTRKV